MDLPTKIDRPASWEDFYLGSRKFQFLADATGLPIDQINFLLGQLLCLIIGYLFRVHMHPKHVSSTSRHWANLTAGLCISFFCFGKQVMLAVSLTFICYIILIMVPASSSHHATLFVSLGFLSLIHIQRQFYEDGAFVLDITGPLMIMVQKITSLAYSLHDGNSKSHKNLTTLQQKCLLRSKPSALEYCSYLLCFQSVLAGPYFMFADYQDFIEGTHSLKMQALKKSKSGNTQMISNDDNSNVVEASTKSLYGDPSPTRAVIEKLLISIVCSVLVVCACPLVPISHITEPSFLSSSFGYRLGYILLATTMSRQLYYTGWYLADAVCNISGFGFSGYDSHGKPSWGLVSNVHMLGVELGSSLKTTLESWNVGTMHWLRFLVYERAPFQRTFFTYFLSSLWHGFYPGYYLTFFGGAFFTICARTVRRSIRHRVVVHGWRTQWCYDIITTAVTRLTLCYFTFPFILLRFWDSLHVYSSMWFFWHVIAFCVWFLLPKVIRPEHRDVTSKSQ